MNRDELALGYVLGTLDEADEMQARTLLTEDQSFAEAVTRSKVDVRDLRRGLDLVAADALPRPGTAARPRWLAALAAAAVVLAIAGGVVLATRNPKAPIARGTQSPRTNQVPGPVLTLDQKVKGAAVIVVGTVTDLRTGSLAEGEGTDYAMATVRVEERIKGAPGDTVVAFDYVYGIVSSEGGPGGVWAKPGDRLLLFLVSDAGTASEDLRPSHLQVFEGAGGRFHVANGELTDAPFTLQDVRDSAAKA
jgi:hypothetical protein